VGTLLTGESCGRARCAGQSQDRLVPFAMQVFPALLVNTLHLQVAEVVAFLHRNPTGHLNFAARSTEPCALHIAPAPTASFSKLACQFARVGNLPAGCHAPSLARGSICCVSQMVFLRQWIVFLAPDNRSFCAASATLLTGFADDKLNNEKARDGKGWQDWLAPVLGTTCGFDMNETLERTTRCSSTNTGDPN
jgi:hypothetical protein